MYRQAAFCYEELITFLPGSANYCIRYADILMTIGGQSHVRAARAYYSKAVALSQGKSVRALMGLLAAGAALGADAKVRKLPCGFSAYACRIWLKHVRLLDLHEGFFYRSLF